MNPSIAGVRSTVAVAALLVISATPGAAQQRDSSANVAASNAAISASTMDTFAAANIAIADFRSKVQAELAEPRSKKAETQASLREKLQAGTERLLKEHNLSDAEFTKLTKRVSTDDVARKQFEDAMARLSKR